MDAGARFVVDRLPNVNDQIRALAKAAKAKGISQGFFEALTWVIDKLERDPLGWGDPEYHPVAKGSTVCHGTHEFLFVQYVVFEVERVVLIMRIRPMPHTGLDS